MLLMVEKVIRGRICHAIHRYAEKNNKYMKNYENIHKFNEDFIKNYDENSHEGYILEVDVECPKKLFDLHSDLPFLPERKKIEKRNKLACTMQDKKKTMLHI